MPFYSIPNGVDASQITGTLPDARLSENVVLVDGTGKVPASKLPSYVDDVVEYSSLSAFPVEGEGGKIYVAVDTGKGYRWSGSTYVEVSASPATTDAVPEGTTNLYHTTARAAAAAPVQSVAGKTGTVSLVKGDVGLGNVDNTSDANKPISTATQTALNGKVDNNGSPTLYSATIGAGDTSGGALIVNSSGVVTHGTWSANAIAVARGGTGATTAANARTSLGVAYGSTAGTVCEGNDARLSDARLPTDGSVTDAKITSGGLSTSSLNWAAIQPWTASTAYAKGDLVSFQGIAYRRSAAGTSGATFNTANWQQITPSDFVASQIASGTIATSRLGSGTASATTYLRGDQAWTEAAASPAVYEFTTTSAPSGATGSGGAYTWPIPAGVKALQIFMVGGGGGGGSGRVDAAGTARSGGGGGGGAACNFVTLLASGISSLDITVGAGGAGGAGVASANGNPGTLGNPTTVRVNGQSSRGLLAFGGGGGGGGTNVSGGGGGGQALSFLPPVNGATGRITSNGDPGSTSNAGCGAGGGGGGVSAADLAYAGGAGSTPSRLFSWDLGLTSAGGNSTGGNGTSAVAAANLPHPSFGGGGGGGGGRVSGGNGGNGGNGHAGGGGGGGGAAVSGNSSGAGGNGGDGLVRIIAW